jgi:hypothetical protein
VTNPSRTCAELLHDPAQVLDGNGLVHFTGPADHATQFGTAIIRGTILACERIDDDA